jgi:hypothetical protein
VKYLAWFFAACRFAAAYLVFVVMVSFFSGAPLPPLPWLMAGADTPPGDVIRVPFAGPTGTPEKHPTFGAISRATETIRLQGETIKRQSETLQLQTETIRLQDATIKLLQSTLEQAMSIIRTQDATLKDASKAIRMCNGESFYQSPKEGEYIKPSKCGALCTDDGHCDVIECPLLSTAPSPPVTLTPLPEGMGKFWTYPTECAMCDGGKCEPIECLSTGQTVPFGVPQ